MTNTNEEKNMEKSEKLLFDVVLFFYQLESMLKNHSSMLSDKISEGDIVSSSIAFNNALILSSIKRILKENPEFEEYSRSEYFQAKLKSMLSSFQTENITDKSDLN